MEKVTQKSTKIPVVLTAIIKKINKMLQESFDIKIRGRFLVGKMFEDTKITNKDITNLYYIPPLAQNLKNLISLYVYVKQFFI